MCGVFSNRRTFKLFIRRLYIHTRIDRQLVLSLRLSAEQDRMSKRTWLSILSVPLMYYLLIVLMADLRPYHAMQNLQNASDLYNRTFKHYRVREKISITTTSISMPTTDAKFLMLPVCFINKTFTVNLILNVTEYLEKQKVTLSTIYPMISRGGYYRPKDCRSRHKVAIIVPLYRNDIVNFPTFLINIHNFLMSQRLEYRIFVVEQRGDPHLKLNKGRLFNVGYLELSKFGSWRCMILHEAHLLPLNPRILYTCPTYPRHMSTSIPNNSNVTVLNGTFVRPFGGVAAFILPHYRKANGYSNMYWGWGEDYDMYWRLLAAELPNVKYSKDIAKYYMLPHLENAVDTNQFIYLHTARERATYEGLNTIKYKLVFFSLEHLYTHIAVEIDPRNK